MNRPFPSELAEGVSRIAGQWRDLISRHSQEVGDEARNRLDAALDAARDQLADLYSRREKSKKDSAARAKARAEAEAKRLEELEARDAETAKEHEDARAAVRKKSTAKKSTARKRGGPSDE